MKTVGLILKVDDDHHANQVGYINLLFITEKVVKGTLQIW